MLSKKDKYDRKYRKENPWVRVIERVRRRCNNKNYPHFKDYGGRGIKCLLKLEEVKFLWIRDKAHLLKKASIDRINNDGNYEISNCRFIEFSENSKKSHRENPRNIYIGSLNGNSKLKEEDIIRIRKLAEINDLRDIAREYDVTRQTIWYIVQGKTWKNVPK